MEWIATLSNSELGRVINESYAFESICPVAPSWKWEEKMILRNFKLKDRKYVEARRIFL